MFGKKYNADEKSMTLEELLNEYVKYYYISIEYRPDGEIYVFIGQSRNPEAEGSEDEDL